MSDANEGEREPTEHDQRPGDVIAIELEKDERRLLTGGLMHWIGPMIVTEELTTVLGFPGLEAFHEAERDLWPRLHRGEPLTRAEWLAVLAATEIAFASAVYRGAGDFQPCNGISDAEGLPLLRAVQKKILPHIGMLLGAGVGTMRRYGHMHEGPRFRRVDDFVWIQPPAELHELPALALGHRVIVFTAQQRAREAPLLRDLGVIESPSDLAPVRRDPPGSPWVWQEVWIFAASAAVPSFAGWAPLFEHDAVTFGDVERELPDPPPTWPLARVEAQRAWLRGCQSRLREALARYRPLTYFGPDMVVTRDPAARAAITALLVERHDAPGRTEGDV